MVIPASWLQPVGLRRASARLVAANIRHHPCVSLCFVVLAHRLGYALLQRLDIVIHRHRMSARGKGVESATACQHVSLLCHPVHTKLTVCGWDRRDVQHFDSVTGGFA